MASPTVIQSPRSANVIGGATTINIDVDRDIKLLDGDKWPFLALMKIMKRKRKGNSYKVEWNEDSLNPRWDQANGAITDSGTSLVVVNGTRFTVGVQIYVPRTGEILDVTARTTNTLTVTRGFGSTTAAAINDNEDLMILAPAAEDGATAVSGKSTLLSRKYNYIQEIRSGSFGPTWQTPMYDTFGDTEAYQKRKKMVEQFIDIEKALWFNVRNLATTGTHYKSTMGGILEYLTDNITTIAGPLTESELDYWMEDVFQYDPDEPRVLFCGKRPISAIDGFAKEKLSPSSVLGTYGINIDKYQTSHGQLLIKKHPMFCEKAPSQSSTGYTLHALQKMAVAICMSSVAYVTYTHPELGDTELIWEPNVETPGQHSKLGEYTSMVSLQFENVEKHGKLLDVRS